MKYERQPELRVMPMPADLNPAGDVFGGWVMSMVDVAGALLARRVAKGRVVTVAVQNFVFKEPIAVGDVVSFYADLVRVGTTSITVDVQVYAERCPENPLVVKVTEARLTYVAVDDAGRKRPVPRLESGVQLGHDPVSSKDSDNIGDERC